MLQLTQNLFSTANLIWRQWFLKFFYTPRPSFYHMSDHAGSMNGRVVIVTGASSGIGKQVAGLLYQAGASVVMACRNVEKGTAVLNEIVAQNQRFCGDEIRVFPLDLSSFESIEAFVKRIQNCRIDFLINNAAMAMCPYGLTKDGIELQFGINHMGHFYLTLLLLPVLRKYQARIVNIGSKLAFDHGKFDPKDILCIKPSLYSPMRYYKISKLANYLFTFELNKRLSNETSGVTAYVVSPGVTRTNLGRHYEYSNVFIQKMCQFFFRVIAKPPEEGAAPILNILTKSKDSLNPNAFYAKYEALTSPFQYDLQANAKELWDLSVVLLGKRFPNVFPDEP